MNYLKSLYRRYYHGIPALTYLVFYMLWFGHLEQTVTKNYEVIHTKLDNYIPFIEIFIIPYLLWFIYVAIVILYLFFKNKHDFVKYCIYLFTGMTVFLIISTFWPNGQHLRPTIMPRNNIFTQMISFLYKADTPTNIWPSIHVYNSLGTHLAIIHSKELKNMKSITISSCILCILIILSTMFIKQHSVFDVFTAFILGTEMYFLVYHPEYNLVSKLFRNHQKKSQTQISS